APFHPVWKTDGTTTVDNAVTWQDQGTCGGFEQPLCPGTAWTMNHGYNVTDTITSSRNSVNRIQQVTVAGISGPSEPLWANTDGATIMDGLTWTDKGTSVVARYPVSGTTTLQALSLDPLVTDCTGSNCSLSIPN